MSTFNPQDLLTANQRFFQEIGFLATIQAGGPMTGVHINSAINQFVKRERRADVAVGDYAYTGNEWGQVSAIASDKITVKFAHTVMPQGTDTSTWNPVRTEVYPFGLTTAVSGANNDNAWQRLGGIGVVFVAPLNPIVATNPAITMTPNPPTISAAGGNIVLTFSQPGVSVQKTVNGLNSGSPVVANGSGVASIPNGNTAGQLIRYIVSKVGFNTVTFGPYTVVA